MIDAMIEIRKTIKKIWAEYGHKAMNDLTPSEQAEYDKCKLCHICKEGFASKQNLTDYNIILEKMKKDNTIRWKRRDVVNLGPKG